MLPLDFLPLQKNCLHDVFLHKDLVKEQQQPTHSSQTEKGYVSQIFEASALAVRNSNSVCAAYITDSFRAWEPFTSHHTACLQVCQGHVAPTSFSLALWIAAGTCCRVNTALHTLCQAVQAMHAAAGPTSSTAHLATLCCPHRPGCPVGWRTKVVCPARLAMRQYAIHWARPDANACPDALEHIVGGVKVTAGYHTCSMVAACAKAWLGGRNVSAKLC